MTDDLDAAERGFTDAERAHRAAQADHRAALETLATARAATAAAREHHETATGHAERLLRQAAAGEPIPASAIVKARAATTEPATALDIAVAAEAQRAGEAQRARETERLAKLRLDHTTAVLQREQRIETATRLDAALAAAEAAIAEMHRIGPHGARQYFIHASWHPIEAAATDHMDVRRLHGSIAEYEAKTPRPRVSGN